jgi:hypothetical protein
MLSITNANGSAVRVKIKDLKIINTRTTAVTGIIADFRLLRCTSHSGGTTVVPAPYDTTNTLDGSITARTGATITGEGTNILARAIHSSDEWGPGTVDTEGTHYPYQLYNSVLPVVEGGESITLNANEGVTLKHVTNSTAGSFDIMMIFTQE